MKKAVFHGKYPANRDSATAEVIEVVQDKIHAPAFDGYSIPLGQ
jgi:hypothetical protein